MGRTIVHNKDGIQKFSENNEQSLNAWAKIGFNQMTTQEIKESAEKNKSELKEVVKEEIVKEEVGEAVSKIEEDKPKKRVRSKN